MTGRDIKNGSLTAKDFSAAAAVDYRVINQSGFPAALGSLSGVWSSAPAPGSGLARGQEHDFAILDDTTVFYSLGDGGEPYAQIMLTFHPADQSVECVAIPLGLVQGPFTARCDIVGQTVTMRS